MSLELPTPTIALSDEAIQQRHREPRRQALYERMVTVLDEDAARALEPHPLP